MTQTLTKQYGVTTVTSSLNSIVFFFVLVMNEQLPRHARAGAVCLGSQLSGEKMKHTNRVSRLQEPLELAGGKPHAMIYGGNGRGFSGTR